MKTQKEIDAAKMAFSQQYSKLTPEQYGLIAAVQHGRLYSPNAPKVQIRARWRALLHEFSRKYIEVQQTQETFIADVCALKERMNQEFPEAFHNGSEEYEDGFRIAHAQKSLSICLKHMWCRNVTRFIPPVCPIDGVILRSLGCQEAWTKVNKIEGNTLSYRYHLAIVTNLMVRDGYSTLSEWELFYWPKVLNSRTGKQNRHKRRS